MTISRTVLHVVAYTLFLTLPGCALYNPYINPPALPPLGTITSYPLLGTSLKDLEDRRSDINGNIKEITAFRTSISLLSFGAAAGTGIAGLFGASKDLMLILGSSAAGTYVFGNLFFGDTRRNLYRAADQALFCVSDRGYGAIAKAENVSILTNSLTDISAKSECQSDTTIQEYNIQYKNFLILLDKDPIVAGNVRQAASKIISALNVELDKSEPSFDVVINAAKGIGGVSASFNTTSNTFGAPAAAMGAGGMPAPVCPDNIIKEYALATEYIKKTINETMADFNAIDDCKLAPPAGSGQLTASKTNIDLGKGDLVEIKFQGGQAPINLTPQWDNTPPITEIDVKPLDTRRIAILGKDGLLSGMTYKFKVSDSSPITNEVMISITTK